MTRRSAIIGAGMAGLTAASRLTAAGHDVTLFDKSRGLGGRMATRRVEGYSFDHGAQYFTAKGPDFRAQIADWQTHGATAEWFEGAHVGTPGMTAPARDLASNLGTIVTSCQVTALARDARGWTISDPSGPLDHPPFDAVVLAIPAPQAVPLAASAGVTLPGLSEARYAPCWALMLVLPAAVQGLDDWSKPDDGTIAWIARNSTKPGRDAAIETIVVHATPKWSTDNLELSPDQARDLLMQRFRMLTGVSGDPLYATAHRWRFALVETPAGHPCLWDARARLGACGDWCLGARVEAAFDSGRAMAEVLLATDP